MFSAGKIPGVKEAPVQKYFVCVADVPKKKVECSVVASENLDEELKAKENKKSEDKPHILSKQEGVFKLCALNEKKTPECLQVPGLTIWRTLDQAKAGLLELLSRGS